MKKIRKIVCQPMGKEFNENMEKSIEMRIVSKEELIDEIFKTQIPEEIIDIHELEIEEEEDTYIWGIRDTEKNRTNWNRIEPCNTSVLFLSNSSVRFTADIFCKFYDEGFGAGFPLLYLIKNIKKVNVSYDYINSFLSKHGIEKRLVTRGFYCYDEFHPSNVLICKEFDTLFK